MARHYSFLFLAISALLPACSRPATCALEGCAKNDSVEMAKDLKPGSDADATAAKKDDWTQTIDDILVRMGAMEALTALLNKTVELHEDRLNGLEERSGDLEASVKSANLRIAHSESEISAIQASLVSLENDFEEKLENAEAQTQLDIAQLRSDIAAQLELFETSLNNLDVDTKASIKTITDAMAVERSRVDAADATVGKAASDNLKLLADDLNKKIADLNLADGTLRSDLLKEIGRLDGRIDTVVTDGARVAGGLWTELGKLQGQLKASDKANQDEQDDLWDKIHTVESRLNAEVIRLNIQDLLLFASTVQLRAKQQQTENDLQTLKTRVDAFIAAQQITNNNVNKGLQTLTTSMSDLKLALEAQIKVSADKVKNILEVLLPALTSRVDTIQATSIPNLEASVNALKTDMTAPTGVFATLQNKVDSLNSDFIAEISDLNHEIDIITGAVASIETCTMSAKYKVDKDWYQDLTCGLSVVKILVK